MVCTLINKEFYGIYMDMSICLQIHPVPIQKTLLLINNFVFNTTSFLNNFTDSCEKKLSRVSGKLSELEILLVVLEAKLDSVPDLSGSTPAPAATSAAAAPAAAPSSTPAPAAADAAPTPSSAPEPAPAPVDSGMVAVEDHPDYRPFAKLLKVGVPLQAAKNKLMAAGK